VWRGQPPLCMTGSRVGSQLSSAQAQPLREGQINNACLRGPMRPGHYFDCGEPLDRSSACSAKRSYSFATLSTACLACSFVRRSARARFSLARSRQCSGSLIKEAGISTRLVLTMVHCTCGDCNYRATKERVRCAAQLCPRDGLSRTQRFNFD